MDQTFIGIKDVHAFFGILNPHMIHVLDRGQTREICEKQEIYFKGKVVILTV